MGRKPGVRGSTFKARVALAALKGDKTLSELAGQFGVPSTQNSTWKQRLVDGSAELFADRRRRKRTKRRRRNCSSRSAA